MSTLSIVFAILTLLISVVIATVAATWKIGSKIGNTETKIIAGQAAMILKFEQELTALKEYTDSKLVPLERRVSHIEGRLDIKPAE